MAIKTHTKIFQIENGNVEGVKLEWEIFSLLIVTAPKGFLTCGIFDLKAIQLYGRAAGIVEGTPDNPVGTLERFMQRNVVNVNQEAEILGVKIGMSAREALNKMF